MAKTETKDGMSRTRKQIQKLNPAALKKMSKHACELLKEIKNFKRSKKYGPIESMDLIDTKTGKTMEKLCPVYFDLSGMHCRTGFETKASEDMVVRVVTHDEYDRRVTFFLGRA
jgi:hypothetical protein